MNPTQTNELMSVEKIAKGLTDAQRLFLLDLPQYAIETYAPAKWLAFKGLAERQGHRFHPTAKGRAVADYLRAHSERTGCD